MNTMTLVVKGLVIRLVLFIASKKRIETTLLSKREKALHMVIWRCYLRRIKDPKELMIFVINKNGKYPYETSLMAAMFMIEFLKSPYQSKYLPACLWDSDEYHKRLGYLTLILKYLPCLRTHVLNVLQGYECPHSVLAGHM